MRDQDPVTPPEQVMKAEPVVVIPAASPAESEVTARNPKPGSSFRPKDLVEEIERAVRDLRRLAAQDGEGSASAAEVEATLVRVAFWKDAIRQSVTARLGSRSARLRAFGFMRGQLGYREGRK